MIDTILLALTIVYVFILLLLTVGLRLLARQKKTFDLPSVSVIVCAHNEEKNLPKCLQRLEQQDYPAEKLEVILVDDRSTDKTWELMTKFAQRHDYVKILQIKDRIAEMAPKKRAIDLAIRNARGEIILLTDADGQPGPHWVRSMMQYFTGDTDMVIGYAPYNIKPARHLVKKVLALEYMSHAVIAAASCGLGYPLTCVGTNMAYRRKVYFEIGGFGPYRRHISGDDDLFLTRIRHTKKYKVKYATDTRSHVYNNPPRLWSKFLHQRVRYASKGFDYNLGLTLSLIIYYLFNFLFVYRTLTLALDFVSIPFAFISAFLLKVIGEWLIISKGARVLGDLRTLFVFPLVAIFHPLYVVIFGALGQLGYFRWSEDKIEAAIQAPVWNRDP